MITTLHRFDAAERALLLRLQNEVVKAGLHILESRGVPVPMMSDKKILFDPAFTEAFIEIPGGPETLPQLKQHTVKEKDDGTGSNERGGAHHVGVLGE